MTDAGPFATRHAGEYAAGHLEILGALIDQGAAIAARIATAATAATTPDSALPEAATAFDRAARAVRRTIALARHITMNPAPDRDQTRITARARLIRGVEDAIHRKRRDTDTQRLHTEFAERLEDPALELDLAGRSVDQVIEEICRDLGIAQQGRPFSWMRRTPKDIAVLRERAATQRPFSDCVRNGEVACASEYRSGAAMWAVSTKAQETIPTNAPAPHSIPPKP